MSGYSSAWFDPSADGLVASHPQEDDLGREPFDSLTRAAAVVVVLGGLVALPLVFAGQEDLGLYLMFIFAGAATLLSPFVGACLLAFSIVFAGLVQVIPGSLTGSYVMAVLLAASFLPRIFTRPLSSFFRSRTLRWYTLVPLWSLVILPFAISPLVGVETLKIQARMIGMAFLLAAVPRNFRQLRYICLSAAAGGAVLGIYVILFGPGALINPELEIFRLGAGTNENTLAHALSAGLVLSAFAWYRASMPMRVLIAVLDLFAVVAIGLTNSRGAWVAIVLCITLAPLITRRVSFKGRLVFFVVAAVLGIAGFMIVLGDVVAGSGQMVAERMRSVWAPDPTAAGGRATWIWPLYIDLFLRNPVMGGGPGAGMIAEKGAHSDLFTVIGTQGLVGLVLFLLMFLAFTREAVRSVEPWLRLVGVAAVVFLFAGGLTHTTVLYKSYPLVIGVLAAVANLGLCPLRRGGPPDPYAYESPPPV